MDAIREQEAAGQAPRTVQISASAARRIAELRRKEGQDGLMLRVTVSGGGCSGFRYEFGFDTVKGEDDTVFERDGVQVVVDSVSLDFLDRAEIDFKEDLMGSYFAINNPNATSSCGCGTSFSVG
jgi:iron-sulfur cluster insertion protein